MFIVVGIYIKWKIGIKFRMISVKVGLICRLIVAIFAKLREFFILFVVVLILFVDNSILFID